MAREAEESRLAEAREAEERRLEEERIREEARQRELEHALRDLETLRIEFQNWDQAIAQSLGLTLQEFQAIRAASQSSNKMQSTVEFYIVLYFKKFFGLRKNPKAQKIINFLSKKLGTDQKTKINK